MRAAGGRCASPLPRQGHLPAGNREQKSQAGGDSVTTCNCKLLWPLFTDAAVPFKRETTPLHPDDWPIPPLHPDDWPIPRKAELLITRADGSYNNFLFPSAHSNHVSMVNWFHPEKPSDRTLREVPFAPFRRMLSLFAVVASILRPLSCRPKCFTRTGCRPSKAGRRGPGQRR